MQVLWTKVITKKLLFYSKKSTHYIRYPKILNKILFGVKILECTVILLRNMFELTGTIWICVL